MIQQELIKMDSVVQLDRFLEKRPKEIYTPIENKNCLEYAIEQHAFDCGQIIYFRMRNDMLFNKSLLKSEEKKSIFTNSLLKLIPSLYEDPSAYILFDRMIIECSKLVDVEKVLESFKNSQGYAAQNHLKSKIDQMSAHSQKRAGLVCLPEDYSL